MGGCDSKSTAGLISKALQMLRIVCKFGGLFLLDTYTYLGVLLHHYLTIQNYFRREK